MPKKGKPPELPPLCMAVKRVRESYGDTLQRFAERLGCSMDSVSRFERGRVPKDREILMNLSIQAQVKGLAREARLFSDAALASPRARRWEDVYPVPHQISLSDMPTLMARIWRLTMAAQIAVYHPESLADMEAAWAEAGSWPLAVVDEALEGAGDPREWDQVALGLRVRQLAEEKASAEFQQRKRFQAKK
jgi:transcriptional regulator with XRE-family HTH domain